MLSFSIIFQIVIFLVAFVARAFFAGSEIAFLSVDKLAVRNRARSGHVEAKRLDTLISDMQRIISIVLVGTNITGALSTVLATSITIELGLFGANGVAVTTMIMIVVVLLFAEILPKNYFGHHATYISLRIGGFINWCGKLFYPFVRLFAALNALFLGDTAAESPLNLTEESIKTMVTIGEEEGAVEESEKDMIYGVFESSETLVREIMVPRIDMVAADIDDGLQTILDLIAESGFSRIPVYQDTIDHIIGILYAKDVLELLLEPCDYQSQNVVTNLLRKAYFVPESKKAGDLLQVLRARGTHVAIVLDEYGGTEGLVTIEDIIEEIVGEIQDEFDEEEEPPVTVVDNGHYYVDPRLSLDKVNELLSLSIEQDDVDTLAGLIYEALGRVPLKNDYFDLPQEHVRIQVTKVDGNRIEQVLIKKTDS